MVIIFHVIDQIGLCAVGHTSREAGVTRAATVLKAAILVRLALVHPALNHVTGGGVRKAVIKVNLVKCCRTFVHSRSGPVCPRNLVLIHPGNPLFAFTLVGTAVTIGRNGTPFRCKHRNALAHGTCCRLSLVTVSRVGGCVEVKRTAVVFIAKGASTFSRITGPTRATDKNQVVRVLTNGRNNPVSMALDFAPATGGFVPDFKNHVVVFTVGLCSIVKELDGVIGIASRAFDVPVNNHVNVVFDGSVHHVLEVSLLQVFTTGDIATTLVKAVAHAHSKAEHFDAHVLHHEVHGLFGIECRSTVSSGTPEKAHALHLDSFVLILRARTRELAAICFKFTVSAYRTHPVRTDCHGGHRSHSHN